MNLYVYPSQFGLVSVTNTLNDILFSAADISKYSTNLEYPCTKIV